jgi:hypothetical protein
MVAGHYLPPPPPPRDDAASGVPQLGARDVCVALISLALTRYAQKTLCEPRFFLPHLRNFEQKTKKAYITSVPERTEKQQAFYGGFMRGFPYDPA